MKSIKGLLSLDCRLVKGNQENKMRSFKDQQLQGSSTSMKKRSTKSLTITLHLESHNSLSTLMMSSFRIIKLMMDRVGEKNNLKSSTIWSKGSMLKSSKTYDILGLLKILKDFLNMVITTQICISDILTVETSWIYVRVLLNTKQRQSV